MENDYQDIFISYRRSDGFAFAEGLANALKAQGFSVFFDKKSIGGGTVFPSAIGNAMDHAREVILVITPDYFDIEKGEKARIRQPSDWARKELARALKKGDAGIFPVLIGCELPRKEQLPNGIKRIISYNFIPYNPAFDTYDVIIGKLIPLFHVETCENAKIGVITKQLATVDVHDARQFNVACKSIIDHLENEHGRNALIHILEAERNGSKIYPVHYRYIVFYTLFSYYRRMHRLLKLLELVEGQGEDFSDFAFTQYVYMEYYQTKFKLETDPEKIPGHILSALKCAKKAVAMLPENNGVLHSFCLAVAVAGENGVEIDQADVGQAMELIDRIIGKAPDYALYYCTKARLQANLGEYESALINLKLAQNLELPVHNDWILRIADYYRQEIIIRLRMNGPG